MIESDWDFQFGDTGIRSKEIVELFLSTPGHVRNLQILFDLVVVNVPTVLGLDVLDGNNLFANHVTGYLYSLVGTNEYVFQYEYR